MKRVKDKCPSCFQPIAPTDFLCPSCELILDPTQLATRPVSEVSVVRRLLEVPQRGVPSERPDTKGAKAVSRAGAEGPTRVLNLGPELAGVPVVVATLTRKAHQLTELEAWVVSIIDGLSDASALAKKAGLKELELRVLLRTLSEKQIIDFADEPLSDEDLDMPIMGTLEEAPPAAPQYGANVDRRDARFSISPSPPGERVGVRADQAPRSISEDARKAGANAGARSADAEARGADLRDARTADARSADGRAADGRVADGRSAEGRSANGRTEARSTEARSTEARSTEARSADARSTAPRAGDAAGDFPFPPAPRRAPAAPDFPFPPAPPRAAVPPPPPPASPPIVPGRAVPPVLAPSSAPAKAFSRRNDAAPPPYPGARTPQFPREAPPTVPPLAEVAEPTPAAERTDPRIAYTGTPNRKVLDALKKVKRVDAGAPAPRQEQQQQNYADVLARDTLQVALRMEQGGRLEEAIRFLEKSIAQSPDAASLYNRLGIILMRERNDLRRAEQLIRKATELAPENQVYEANLKQVVSQQALKSHRR